MNKIFICYSHEDEKTKDDLLRHLKLYRDELVALHDREISLGDKWKDRIINYINSSTVTILLVSIDFLNSKFIEEEEIPRIFAKKYEENMGVFPFIIEPCDWQYNKQISDLQAMPKDARPLSFFRGPNREQALVDFAKKVKERIIDTVVVYDVKWSDRIPTMRKKDVDGVFSVNSKEHILDQLYDYFSYKFKEINYLPINLLIRDFPFRKEKSYYPHYSVFSLSTDNEKLIDFFETIKIKKDGQLIFTKNHLLSAIENYEEKTKTVLKKLTNNLVFNINDKTRSRQIDIFYRHEKKCNCVSCQFSRFEFSDAFKQLSITPSDIDEQIKLAYTNYQIGNFLKSEILLSKISEESKRKKQKITQFLTQFNLLKLGRFIELNYWGDNKQDILVKRLKEINLENVFKDFVTEDNESLLGWIKNNSFYSDSLDKIQKLTSKIRDHFYSQLKGGWSSNNYVWELINEYSKIDAFLNHNHIMYDGFSEFIDLTDTFIEGVFASHAIKDPQNSRLVSFDDWMISKIIFYGNTNNITKHFGRYGIVELNYKQDSTGGYSFMELFENFMTDEVKTRSAFKKYCEENNRYFWNRYNTIFSNLITLASILNLNKKQVNKVAVEILSFLESETSILPQHIKYVRIFINRKGKQIKKATLNKYLLLIINNRKIQKEDFIEAVAGQIKKYHGNIHITIKDYAGFENLVNKEKLEHNQDAVIFLIYLFEVISNGKIRDKIKLNITKSLKDSFNSNLYYLSVLYEVIYPDGDLFEKFIDTARPSPNKKSFKSVFSGIPDNRITNLNMLLNLCYKYNIDLNNNSYDEFRGLSDYYDWLLNMRDFNYDLFNPKWANEYATKYYAKEMNKYPIIKKKVCEYLKTNKDPELERDYIELFC